MIKIRYGLIALLLLFTLSSCDIVGGQNQSPIVSIGFEGVDGVVTIVDDENQTVSVTTPPLDLNSATPVFELARGSIATTPVLQDGVATELVIDLGARSITYLVTIDVGYGMSFTLNGERYELTYGLIVPPADPGATNADYADGLPFAVLDLDEFAGVAFEFPGSASFNSAEWVAAGVYAVLVVPDLDAGSYDLASGTYFELATESSFAPNAVIAASDNGFGSGELAMMVEQVPPEIGDDLVGTFSGVVSDDDRVTYDAILSGGFFKLRRGADL